MSFGPTAKCFFCGGIYYAEKLASHESICSMRPKRLTVRGAVEMATKLRLEASGDGALLVRLVWQIFNGYRTDPPQSKLTDPALILARARSLRRKRRPKRMKEVSKARYQ